MTIVESLERVGIGQFIVSAKKEGQINAPNLGSCLGLAIFEKKSGIGGVGHFFLPLSSMNPAEAAKNPAKFVDTGFEAMLAEILGTGVKKSQLIIVAAGCASMLDPEKHFNIGERNMLVLRKHLWKHGLLLHAERVGGGDARSLILDLARGMIQVQSGNNRENLL